MRLCALLCVLLCIQLHRRRPNFVETNSEQRPRRRHAGTARSAVELWRGIRALAPPGPLQLAGGTNSATVQQLDPHERPAGIAFGGSARRLLMPLLKEAQNRGQSLRDWPDGWDSGLAAVQQLVTPWLERPC